MLIVSINTKIQGWQNVTLVFILIFVFFYHTKRIPDRAEIFS